jgi:hypothetical protein
MTQQLSTGSFAFLLILFVILVVKKACGAIFHLT